MPKPSLSVRNHNPGNIRDGKWAAALPGYVGPGERGFAKFSDWGMGLAAMARLLRSSRYRDKSLAEVIGAYAPAKENDTKAYIEFVSLRAGLRPEDPITNPITLCEVMAAMIEREGWRP